MKPSEFTVLLKVHLSRQQHFIRSESESEDEDGISLLGDQSITIVLMNYEKV